MGGLKGEQGRRVEYGRIEGGGGWNMEGLKGRTVEYGRIEWGGGEEGRRGGGEEGRRGGGEEGGIWED